MDINYNNKFINDGQILTVEDTLLEPTVTLNQGSQAKSNFYSLIMIDVDAPVGKKDTHISFLHWWIANIDLSRNFNQVWFEYFPPSPPPNTGIHHYYFYLLLQDSVILKPGGINSITSRAPFNLDYYIRLLKMNVVATKYFIIKT